MVAQYNPFLPENRADPYPQYRQLRNEDPVHKSEMAAALGVQGLWVLSRYRDVVSALRDGRLSADRRQAALTDEARQAFEERLAQQETPVLGDGQTMLTSDPPDHTRLRGLVSKAFTPAVVEAMRPHIQEIVDGLLDDVQGAGRMDIIADLAYPLPVIVIAEMLGIPGEDRAEFKRWSGDIAATLDPVVAPEAQERADRSANELVEYFRGVIEEHRREPRDDLVSALIAAEQEGDRLTEAELYATCLLLLVAGNETTTNLIGNGMLALLRHPGQLQRLRKDQSLIESAVEELLRYDSPVQATARVAMDDLEIGGCGIHKGDFVITLLGAANRDPEQFPDPDTLDITRKDNRHVAFGYGVHFCLGAPLARVEGQVAISTLLRRLPRLALAGGAPDWRETVILRGLKALPVTC